MSTATQPNATQPVITLAEPTKVAPLVWQAHPTQGATWQLVNSNAPSTVLGSAQGQWPAGYSVEAYSSKGGYVILLHSPLGLTYFVMPGASVQGNTFKLTLAGNLWQNTQAKLAVASHTPAMVTLDHPVRQAMILGAGIGTRILPLTETWTGLAKPSLPLDGQHSVIGRLVHHLAQFGLEHCYVNTFFAAPSVCAALDLATQETNTQWHNLPEARATGTAGGLVQLLQHPERYPTFDATQPLLIVQGDAVTNADFGLLIKAHQQHQPLVTIGCQIVSDEDVDKFGIIATQTNADATDPSGVVTHFIEKPTLAEAGDYRLGSTGFYVLSPQVLPLLLQRYTELLAQQQAQQTQAGEPVTDELKEFDFAHHVFPWLLAQHPDSLRAQAVGGYWCDIGNPYQYVETLIHLAEGGIPLLPAAAVDETGYDAEAGVVYWPNAKALADSDAEVLELAAGVLVTCTTVAKP
jgi:NDP-sugar pyrophosphorylase family protein